MSDAIAGSTSGPANMEDSAAESAPAPRWKPLGRIDRRVAGVLIEKAKTTPDQYPMTVNGLVNGCNQKSNRDPQMQLEENDILDSLERLKACGAVVEVQGSGRVPKFRHLLYEWLGTDKVGLAVMAELLLRGAQTEGELRGRASRMEPIPDLPTLRTILDTLRKKGLVIDLSPPGRGHIVSHGLYEPEELERLRQRYSAAGGHDSSGANEAESSQPARSRSADSSGRLEAEIQTLRAEVAELRAELEKLAAIVRG